MNQNDSGITMESSQVIADEGEGSCSCNKKQCMLGLASITIGVGGLVLAYLL